MNNTQDCTLILGLTASTPVNRSEAASTSSLPLLPGRIPDFSYSAYLYWMGGASVCGLVWACVNVLTLLALSELIRTHLVLLAKIEKEVADQ